MPRKREGATEVGIVRFDLLYMLKRGFLTRFFLEKGAIPGIFLFLAVTVVNPP